MDPKVRQKTITYYLVRLISPFLGSGPFLPDRWTCNITPRQSSPPVAFAKRYLGTQVSKYLYE
jgi:hypothetical protein